jgi:cobalt/nickel transport protein
MKSINKLWIGIIILILLSPIGLILPEKFEAGTAWGEWGLDEIEQQLGFVPEGMEQSAETWSAPMPDYAFKNQEEAPISVQSISYIISGIIGVAIVAAISLIIGKLLAKREESDTA